MCLNGSSIVYNKNELNSMVEDIDPHITGITELWANTIRHNNAELGLIGYTMFRTDRKKGRGRYRKKGRWSYYSG